MADRRSLRGLHALVVEDEYFVASDIKRILKREGAELVVLSGSIEDAARQIRERRLDFGLLDINIRGEMCFSLAEELRRRRIPFAFVSGYCRSKLPSQFAAVPNWGKPYDERGIVDGIRTLWAPPAEA